MYDYTYIMYLQKNVLKIMWDAPPLFQQARLGPSRTAVGMQCAPLLLRQLPASSCHPSPGGRGIVSACSIDSAARSCLRRGNAWFGYQLQELRMEELCAAVAGQR